jgi:hypothetical protein
VELEGEGDEGEDEGEGEHEGEHSAYEEDEEDKEDEEDEEDKEDKEEEAREYASYAARGATDSHSTAIPQPFHSHSTATDSHSTAIPQPFHSHSTRITRPRRQQSTFERQPHSTHRARLGTLAPARSSLPAES